MERQPSYDPSQPLIPANVYGHVHYMHSLPPRQAGHDAAMRKLFDYIGEQIGGLGHNPATFFDREVGTRAALGEAIIAAAKEANAAVADRGRGQSGQKGDYFWDGAEDIEEQYRSVAQLLWACAQKAGISPDTWMKQVMMARRG